MARVATPVAYARSRGVQQVGIDQFLQDRLPGTRRGMQEQSPIGLEVAQEIPSLEQAPPPLIGPGKRQPIAVAAQDEIRAVQGDVPGFVVGQPAEAGPGPGQVDQPQPVPGGPFQWLAPFHEFQQDTTGLTIARRQTGVPAPTRLRIGLAQPVGIQIPGLPIALAPSHKSTRISSSRPVTCQASASQASRPCQSSVLAEASRIGLKAARSRHTRASGSSGHNANACRLASSQSRSISQVTPSPSLSRVAKPRRRRRNRRHRVPSLHRSAHDATLPANPPG